MLTYYSKNGPSSKSKRMVCNEGHHGMLEENYQCTHILFVLLVDWAAHDEALHSGTSV